jgi:hypothetical protein
MRPTPRFEVIPVRVPLSFTYAPPRPLAYANLYRFGRVSGARPLVCYVGGATRSCTHGQGGSRG